MQDAGVTHVAGTSWEAVYRDEAPKLWHALVLHTGMPEIASDAVAEAFAQGIGRGASVRNPGAWVWKAAFMLARGDLRRRKRDVPDVPDRVAHAPIDTIDLMRALRVLTPKQRGSIVLHHYAGYSTKETAAILGSTAAAVGVHLDRGRKRLRELLGEDDG
jgi:RNA polymerase sigma-70 factor (ECF subfamily)